MSSPSTQHLDVDPEPMPDPRLLALPASGLVDDPLQVTAHNLVPGATVKLTATMPDEQGFIFRAEALYVADASGSIDTSVHPSVGGFYTGVRPSGLLSHMVSDECGRRWLKRDVTRPTVVTITLGESPATAISTTIERWYLAPGVKVHEVNVGRIRGRIYEPPPELGRVPAVVDIFGVIGGLVNMRPALLASRGFLAYSCSFVGYKDLPRNIPEACQPQQTSSGRKTPAGLDLGYFEEVARYLQQHPRNLEGAAVGVIGTSFGAGVACAMQAYLPPTLVGAAVAINNGPGLSVPLRLYDEVIYPRFLAFDPCTATVNEEGLGEGRSCYDTPEIADNKGKLFPVWNSPTPLMLVASSEDRAWPSLAYVHHVEAILRRHGHKDYVVRVHQDAGHLLEMPNTPLNRCTKRTVERSGLFQKSTAAKDARLREWLQSEDALIDWGGTLDGHAAGQQNAWTEACAFFDSRLRASAARAQAAKADEQAARRDRKARASSPSRVGVEQSVQLALESMKAEKALKLRAKL